MPTYRESVDLYHETVFRVARGVLRDDAAAEDVTQDVETIAELEAALGKSGMTGRPLDSVDRQRLILTKGVRIVHVEPGSPAEAGGFLVGDVIWKVHGPEDLFTGNNAMIMQIIEPSILGWIYEEAVRKEVALELGVVRGEETMRLMLKGK